MVLKTVHDKVDEIPEEYRPLYTEKDGKWELTGITGVKTQADVDRVQRSLTKERDEHKATKSALAAWGDRKPEDTLALLDRIPELEAAAKGKIDDVALDEMATKRAEAMLRTKLGPVERQLAALTAERDELAKVNSDLTAKDERRAVTDSLRSAFGMQKDMIPEAIEDVLTLGLTVFERRADDGAIVTRDGAGFPAGLAPEAWLPDLRQRRPHWWKGSQGGGARDGSPVGGVANNPWTAKNWNLTEQGKFIREHGAEKAAQAAAAAGSRVGATAPPADKK